MNQYIAGQIMKEPGALPYTANINEAWKVVEKMIRQYHR